MKLIDPARNREYLFLEKMYIHTIFTFIPFPSSISSLCHHSSRRPNGMIVLPISIFFNLTTNVGWIQERIFERNKWITPWRLVVSLKYKYMILLHKIILDLFQFVLPSFKGRMQLPLGRTINNKYFALNLRATVFSF